MSKYIVTATRTTVCQIEIDADNEMHVHELLEDWMADDFEQHIVDSKWVIDVEEKDN